MRDFERAAEWCGKVAEFSRRMQTNFVTLACRAHYGAVLTWQGRWPEAEKSLIEAERLALERPSWGGLAIVRLADLRRRQGRFAEAEELLQRAPGNALAPVIMAELALDLGDPSIAVDLLKPPSACPDREQDPARRAGRGDGEGDGGQRGRRCGRVSRHRAAVDRGCHRNSPAPRVAQPLRRLVAAAAGDHEAGRARLGRRPALRRERRILRARAGAARAAGVLASLGRGDAAVREAQLALMRLEEIGAGAEAARARDLLRTLGASPKRKGAGRRDQILTPREVEILRLVSEGLTDGGIAARLVLSKHTVHRHLQNAYAKLGCSSRAAAVTKAHKLHLL